MSERYRLLFEQVLGAPPDDVARRPVTDDTVTRIRETSQHLVALDGAHGGDGVVSCAVRAFRAAHDRLTGGRYPDRLAREIASATSEAAEVAGWVAYDADRHDLARRLNLESLMLARTAGDTSMERFALGAIAMQDVHLRRPGEALRIAEAELETGPGGRVAAICHLRRGRALAQLGAREDALASIRRARRLVDDGGAQDDPAWTWWVRPEEVDWHEAVCHSDLGDWGTAVELHARSSAGRWRPRSKYTNLAYLLDALIQVRSWAEVPDVVTRVLPSVGVVGSRRTAVLLRQAIAVAHKSGAPPAVLADLDALDRVLVASDTDSVD